jgi:hypothetical protein
LRVYHCFSGVAAIAATGMIAAPSTAPPASGVQTRAVGLTSGEHADSPLGDGTALLMGGTSIPQPGDRYLDAANTLYLQPHGFDGTLQSLYTPETSSSTSVTEGEQILDSTILEKLHNGDFSADDPLVVFGYSQSASIASEVMRELDGQDVPKDEVHFVLIGDPDNPNGGPDVTDSTATPNDLYPTDVYTHEYDGVADFPRYPIDFLSDLNAMVGFVYEHLTYLNVTPDQIDDAIELPTSSADTSADYYMIPAETLPLLDPLRLIPVIGQPVYDLLEPDTRILVNLGYGSIDHGWAPGDADVVHDSGVLPTDLNPGDVLTALGNGLQQGIGDFVDDLQNPDTYQITPLVDNPSLAGVEEAGFITGFLDTPHPTFNEALDGLSDFIQAFTAS